MDEKSILKMIEAQITALVLLKDGSEYVIPYNEPLDDMLMKILYFIQTKS